MILEDSTPFHALDPEDMANHIFRLPEYLESAWMLGQTQPLPDAFRRITRMIIAGVNEAALAGELLAALMAESCNIPMFISRAYDLPAYADGQSTLVVLIDHAGTTEEAFSALELADARGTKALALTSGGALADYAARSGVTVWRYNHDGPARTALPWEIGLLLAFFNRLGLVRDLTEDVTEAVAVLRRERAHLCPECPPTQNAAKRLAGQMIGRLPLIYGAGLMVPVARRWKQQINANAKAPAVWDELPEMDYNTLSGLELVPDGVRLAPVCLIAPHFDHPRITLRQQHTRAVFMMQGCVPDTLEARGECALAQVMNAVQFGDYLSFYLAMAYGVDPTPTPATDEIQAKLASTR